MNTKLIVLVVLNLQVIITCIYLRLWSSRAPLRGIMKTRAVSHLMDDMRRCSLAMGMTREDLRELQNVATKVQMFLDVLQTIIPPHFSKKFKNPCWEEINSRQSKKPNSFCLPYFFLAGFPECGTTSLHFTLSQHPQIFAPGRKEPHWWTRVALRDMKPKFMRNIIMKYLNYFELPVSEGVTHPEVQKWMITYDGTQSTLWDSNFFSDATQLDYCAMPAILSRVLPNGKLMVIMRNPVTRIYSDYYRVCHDVHVGEWPKEMQEDPAKHFHTTIERDIRIFNNCLMSNNHSLPWCIGKLHTLPTECGNVGERLLIGLYYIHLHKWMQFYPRENFLFLRTEDIKREPHRMITQITEFLEVDTVSEVQAKTWFSSVLHARKEYTEIDPDKLVMRPESKTLLEDFFKPYNAILADFIGDQRFLWKDT